MATPAINPQAIIKYRSYTDEQLAAEFLSTKRNDGSYVIALNFVPDVLGDFLGDKDKDGKTYAYSRVKKSVPLLQALYDIYVTNSGSCDYSLNLPALTQVLENFARTNTRAIPDESLMKYFENFFTPLLKRAYDYRNNNQLTL